MRKTYNYLFALLIGICFVACSDTNDESNFAESNFLNYAIRGYAEEAVIDTETKSVFLQLPAEVADGNKLYPEFEVSEGAVATINHVPQVSGEEEMDFSDLVLYTVTAAGESSKSRWKVTVTNNNYTSSYGMGNFLTQWHSNESASSDGFYLQQQHTGPYSANNCGPACSTMALRWAKPTYTGTVEQARNEIPVSTINGGVSWYPRDVYNFLNNHGVKAYYWNFTGATYTGFVNTICTKLKEGNLAIVCLNSVNISEQKVTSKEYHTHKYYSGGTGHFLLIKGFRVVNGTTWLEVHDPWGIDKKYADGSYMGANRYYLGTEVATSINWNIWTVIVPPITDN